MVLKGKRGRPRQWHTVNETPSPKMATTEQLKAFIALKPGDIIQVRLRTGNVQRFKVCVCPAEFKPGPGSVHAQKYGQGPFSAMRHISPWELVV